MTDTPDSYAVSGTRLLAEHEKDKIEKDAYQAKKKNK